MTVGGEVLAAGAMGLPVDRKDWGLPHIVDIHYPAEGSASQGRAGCYY